MTIEGGCFCGALRYALTGGVLANGECCCSSCQTFTGGGGNPTVAILAKDIEWTRGDPASFQKSETGAIRQFCAACGTQITAEVPSAKGILTVKAGTFDNRSAYSGPKLVIWTSDKPDWLPLPEDAMTFEKGAPSMPKAF